MRNDQANYFENGMQLNEMHSRSGGDRNSSISMCQDGITRRMLTFVAGCTLLKSDLEVRSSCSSDMSYPKCKCTLLMKIYLP